MVNSETIKTTIDANINTNGNQAITGAVMNSVLKQMVDSTDAELAKLATEIGNMTSGGAVQELAGDVNGKYDTIATTTYVSGTGVDLSGLTIEKGKAYKVQISLEESKVNSQNILGGIKLYKNGVLVQTVVSTTIVLDEPIKEYDFVADEDADQIKTGYVYDASSTKTFELQKFVKGLSQKLQETSEIILGEIEQGGFEYNQENPSDYLLTETGPVGRLCFRTDNASPYSGIIRSMKVLGNLESRSTPRVEVVVLRKEADKYKGISSHTLYIHPGLNQFNNLNIEVEQGDILGVSGNVGKVSGTIRTYNIAYDGNVESLNFALSSAQHGNHTYAFFPYLEPNYKEALAEQIASNDIVRVSREPLVPNKNLFDKDNLVEKLWVRETGVFRADNHNGIYIKVKEGFTYCWNRDDRYTGFIALMDSELNYISSVVESQLPRTSEGGYMFTIPQNVAYIAFEVNHNEDTFQFEEGIHNTSYEPYRLVRKKEETAIPQNFDVYANVCILGDSTASTYLGAWYYWLTSKYSLFNCLDLAVGGATYSHKANTTIDTNPEANPQGDSNVIVNQVNRLMMLINNGEAVKPDVFLILGGRNDCTRGEEYLGNADETCEDETTIYSDLVYNDAKLQTMCGGIRMVVETILKNIPNARIVLMSPLHASRGAKKTIKARDLVENMASYLSCDFLDLTKMSGISFVSERQYYYTSDTVHPSVLGGRRIADIVGNYLMTLFHKKWMDYAKYKVAGTGDANTLYSFNFIEELSTSAQTGVQSVTTDGEGKYEVLLGAGRWRVYKGSGVANLVKDWFDVTGDMTLDL